MLDVKEEIRKHWDSRSKEYDGSPGHVDLPETWKNVLSEIFPERMRVLDIGTGTGFIALLLAELGHDVAGIDFSKGMLEIAREKARKSRFEIQFEIGDAECLPFEDNSFDATICRHVLWTLPHPQKAIKEWQRIVKPGGKVVVIDGAWFSRSFTASLRRFIGQIWIAAYERRNPWNNRGYREDLSRMLPLYGTSTPEKVVELFRNAELSRISVRNLSWIRDMMLENRPFAYRLAWGDKAYFLVEGFKEV